MFPDEEGTETMHPVLGGYHVRGSTMFPDEEGTETTYFRMRTPKSSVVRRCSPMRRGLKLVGALIGPLPAQPGSTMFPDEEGTETDLHGPRPQSLGGVRRCSPMRRGLKQNT